MYRDREGIMATKQEKGGNSAASWFLKGDTRQVLNVPSTPGSKLARQVQSKLKGFVGPDRGVTKVVERAGKRITIGLQKDDPFPKQGCMYDEECLMGPGCNSTSTCYEIKCDECDDPPQVVRPTQSPTQMTAGSRRVRNKYIGQSGTTIHKRQRSHLRGSKSVLKNTVMNITRINNPNQNLQ